VFGKVDTFWTYQGARAGARAVTVCSPAAALERGRRPGVGVWRRRLSSGGAGGDGAVRPAAALVQGTSAPEGRGAGDGGAARRRWRQRRRRRCGRRRQGFASTGACSVTGAFVFFVVWIENGEGQGRRELLYPGTFSPDW
jgi:hypothetical protein